MVPQILDSLVSNYAINISVHIQYQCFHYAMTWENDQEIQKITIKWNWCSNGFWSFWLSLWFASWKMHNDTLLKVWVFVMLWLKKISDPKITQGVKLQTLLLLWNITSKGLANHIRNIPKKPYTQSYREVYFSLGCDGKVRQQGDHWFFQEIIFVKGLIWTRHTFVDTAVV